jgi:hypothetical protein
MAGNDDTYQNSKVGIEQGADTLFVDSDGYFRLNGTQYSGDTLGELINQLQLNNATVKIMDSGTVLSGQGDGSAPPILPSTYGIIIFSAVATNMSARMFSAGSAGREVILMTRFGSTQSLVIYLSGHTSGIAGAAVQGVLDSGLSSIQLRGSAASHAVVKLVSDGSTWNVVGYEAANNNITLNAE